MKKNIWLCCFFVLLQASLWAQMPPVVDPPMPIPGPEVVLPGTESDPKANGETPTDADKFDKAAEELEKKTKEEENEKRKKQQQQKDDESNKRDILALQRQSTLPEAKIWGQQFFRDQSLSLFTRSRDVKALASYRLGVGDELIINVWGRAAFSANVIIDEEGYIDMSGAGVKIPRLYVKGLRFADAQKSIRARLSKHMDIDGSQYAIEINFSRNISINITGEVFSPGSYTIPATNTAFNALVASGGPSQIGSVRKIKVVSRDQEPRILDVYKFVTNPNIAEEFFLANNDYIYVPLAERVVQIQGSIKRPFFYELIEGEQLISLLGYAGGLQADAYLTNIQIKRYKNDEERLIDLNLGQVLEQKKDFELMNGDIIIVAPIKQAYSNYIKVVGAVKLPGEYELQKDTRVRDVLMKAGIIYSAVMERIYLKRLREDLSIEYININVYNILNNADDPENIVLRPFDEIEVKYKSEFIDKYNVRIYGAVRKPGDYQYSKNLTLADVLYMANGVRLEATNSVVEVSRMQKQGGNATTIIFKTLVVNDSLQVKDADKFYLEPYDQIFVRTSKEFELPKNITLQGEVRFPGIYTLASRKERVADVLQRAGGLTDVAFLEGAKLQRRGDGLVLLDLRTIGDTNSVFNYILQEGDVIVVPRVKDLVSIAGAVNHPLIRDKAEIADMELELELKKAANDLARQEIITQDFIKRKQEPIKINVPYHAKKRANFYVERYGAGLNRKVGGRKYLIYVRYANGLVKRTRNYWFFKRYPLVEKGAMVYAEPKPKKPKEFRQREPFSWSVFAQAMQGILSMIMTSLTVFFLIRRL